MSKNRVNGQSAQATAGSAKTGAIPIAPKHKRTTSDLAGAMMDIFDGLMADTVPLAKAGKAAQVATVVIKCVEVECKYGPQQERRKSLDIQSPRAS